MTNEVLSQLEARKSVRVFTGEPVDRETKRAVLEAAFQAPTAGCQQLYTILDITEQPLKDRLAVLCDNQPFIAFAPVVLIFLADCQRWLDAYRTAGCRPRRPGPGDLLLAMADACIAAQNAVTAAHSLGLGSCYIGDILEQCEQVRETLELPQEVMPAAMLVLGWPTRQQMERPKPARAPMEYLVFENRYQTLTPEQHRALIARQKPAAVDYDQWMTAFWKRKYESDFAREMSRSAAAYLEPFLEEGSGQNP